MKRAYTAPMTCAETISSYMTRLYDNGMTTTSGGNLSIMDENGSLWISPSGVDKAHLCPDDIMEVTADGVIKGKHRPSTEYPFHLAVRRVRPDLKAVLHAHPAALVALSLARLVPDIDLYPGVKELCGEIAVAKYALPGSDELGGYVAEKFAQGYNVVILENHGVCLGAETMEQAYRIFEAFEYAARVQIAAATLGGGERHLSADELAVKSVSCSLKTSTDARGINDAEGAVRDEVIDMIRRCYKNKLFTASYGVFAARAGNGFVITPKACDVMNVNPEELVFVSDGTAYGNAPCEAEMIAEIFAKHSDINSVAVSRAPEIMGFAVTDAKFDSHLIPEGYICLRNVSRYPFGTLENDRTTITDNISMSTPIVIVENDCAIVAGTSPLNTYDRLEVMEFGALSLRHLAALKKDVIRISPKDIRDIEIAFNLV